MQLYDVVFLICNLFMTYTLYKYHRVFYAERRVGRWVEIAVYGAYFVINSIVYLLIKIPLLVMTTTVILIFLFSLLYAGDLKKRLLTTAIIYSTIVCIEVVVVSIGNNAIVSLHTPSEYQSVIGIIAIHLATYALVLVLSGLKHGKSNLPIPTAYWLSLLIIPTGTMVLLFTLLGNGSISYDGVIGSVCAVLLINLVAFYLYDCLSGLASAQINTRLQGEQERYYESQLELMKSTLTDTKRLRHDIKNQLSPLYQMVMDDKKEILLQHISEILQVYGDSKDLSCSGNIAVDSILNFKLNQAKRLDIEVSAEVLVPSDLEIPSFDLAIILGNLLDNAIEGALTIPQGRWLDVKVKCSKGRLLVTLNNVFDGELKRRAGRYLSRKDDADNHGLGLDSIRNTLDKYDGALQLEHSKEVFTAKVLMYAELPKIDQPTK